MAGCRFSAFVSETATRQLLTKQPGNADKTIECPVCEKTVKHKVLCSHMGGHILRAQMGISEDNINVSMVDPCGFCSQSGHPVQLVKEGWKRTFQPSSSCPFSIIFSIGAAANSTKTSPSTNVPIQCPLCLSSSSDHSTILKYNMAHHISAVHSGLNPNQPLPLALAMAMKITRSEQQALGIPLDLISGDDELQTPASGKRKRAATRSTVHGEASKRSKD
ncbi:hypothetical protein PAXRUDRAFT_159905 [Paxillus rubicundulus Ve08.2h10]|uniref:Uncharacterized protein n=1 Tax=Paxillus rubicundulus Ve08.2h10 TaxID=930991 RepID=A0A0D0DFT7_9AGAM|nr:hypothetical protein PAXRUDRAFT_159905 [Paxillus rubicundulus Ve08.2h10]